ncbi:hypothetical protein BKG83_12535 [Mycobacteroides chelonae]|uniref:hypothetical protein n=1 Tax=Mycobacteroides chelonae TaxID=1774 RepID=UPI0008A8327D|nr:hypothetical protein [Mycobacteroides chelonae]OHU55136.1 hypothetical protein BKG83_12535 [Mycobacteroides chelonae]
MRPLTERTVTTLANSDQLPPKPTLVHWTIVGAAVVATIVAAVVGFTAGDTELVRFVQGIVTPLLALVSGILIADLYHRIQQSNKLDRNVGQSAYATMVTLQGMIDVDKHLATASNDLNEGNKQSASSALNLALTISRLTLRHAFQALRESENVSSAAVAKAKTDFATAETAGQPERQKIETASRPNNYTVGVGNA